VEDTAKYVPAAPPALNSSQYRSDFEQVKALGSATSTRRTADQTVIARFWANGAGTSTPPGHWNQIARVIVRRLGMRVGEEARLFALLNIAMADAAIVAWKTKYQYNYWRPITAIREAEQDGNPATTADPSWTPLLATPPFPEYTSGHSTFSGAAAMVLERITGRRNFLFTATSDDAPGITRNYADFRSAAAESGMSRIYGGIHFWSGNEAGLRSGAEIGHDVANNLLRRVGGGRGPASVAPGANQKKKAGP
jgi:PAP2 superfamily